MLDTKPIIDALVEGDAGKLAKLVQAALDGGASARRILDEGLMAGMDVVGERMENEDMFHPGSADGGQSHERLPWNSQPASG